MHLEDGEARRVAAEVDGGHDAAGGRVDGYGEGAEADLELLVDERIAVAADVAEDEAELLDWR